MAAVSLLSAALGAAEEEQALKDLDTGLAFLFDQQKIPKDIQAMVSSLGYSDAGVFAELGSDVDAVRKIFKDDVGLDPDKGAKERAMTARLVATWRSAQTRSELQLKREAEQRVGDLPRTIPKPVHIEMRRAFTRAHEDLPKKLTPAPVYIEGKISQMEDGELVAESLADVLTVRDVEGSEETSLKLKNDGTVVFQKGKVTGTMPSTTEELRDKIRVMGIAWEFVRLKYTARPVFSDLDDHVWSRYLDWLLGEDVNGLVVSSVSAGVEIRPDWQTLLSFELEVRRKAFHDINLHGGSIRLRLQEAMKDSGLLTRYLITPTSMAAGARAAVQAQGWKRPSPGEDRPSSLPPPAALPDWGKGKGKGKGKPKGKGIPKCGPFQRGKCKRQNCKFLHACWVCDSRDHGSQRCPERQKGPGGDAAGRPSNLGAGDAAGLPPAQGAGGAPRQS